MVEQAAKLESVSSANSGFNGASALSIRLDTNMVLQDIENFLRGREENFYRDSKTGRTMSRLDKVSCPKANDEGIQDILNYCRSLINPQVVQGNYDKKDWLNFIVEKRMELIEKLVINFYEYKLPSDDTMNGITDFIMNLAEPFLSRMIDNEERSSYAETFKTMESNRIENKSAMSTLFGGGNK